MSTFTPKDITPFKNSVQPEDLKSQRIFLDQQLRDISRAITTLHTAVEQLQAEQALIWSALNALGQTRP